MKLSAFSLLSAASLILGSPVPRDVPEGVVQLAIQKVASANTTELTRRAYTEPLENGGSLYVSTIQVGTPAQSVETQLDTGSSDLWVYGKGGPKGASFDSSKSSTYKVVQKGGFSIVYGSGTAAGDWVTDTVAVGGASVKNQRLAVANGQAVPIGVFGVGLTSGEASQSAYPNYPQSLRNAGLVAKNAYSLYLNSYDADEGNVLFGGIDTAKYSGKLHQAALTQPTRLSVHTSYGDSAVVNGLLDSGTTITYVTDDIYDQLTSDLQNNVPAIQQDWDGSLYVDDINDIPADATFTFNIGGANFDIPVRNIFGQWGSTDGYTLGLDRISTIPRVEAGLIILGDSFLRSFYVVYNLEDRTLALAPVVSTSKSSIVAIGSSGIPSNLLA